MGKSTVPPGTAERLGRIATDASPAGNIGIAWNPEFLREGCAVQDTLMPDRIVVGTASTSAEATLREVYSPLTERGIPLIVTDFATAELVKGAANAFLASKISFINAIADICAEVGGDIHALAEALGLDPRIGPSFLKAGIGYGGACLPKDVRGLAVFADRVGAHDANHLLLLVDAINHARRDLAVQLIVDAPSAGPSANYPPTESLLNGKRIAVLGAAFKPETDDVRDSPGLDVATRLHLLGATVTVYDPMATANALTVCPELVYTDSALAAIDRTNLIAVVTAWPEFGLISPAEAALAAASLRIVDACQGIDAAAWRAAGWSVRSLTGGQTGLTSFSSGGSDRSGFRLPHPSR